MERREFLTRSLAAVAGSFALSTISLAEATRPIGLQMYTLRDLAEKDLAGVLAAVHRIGYQEVELYWNLYSHPAAELKKMLADNDLAAPSGHLDYEGLESKLEYARELGLKYVICPMLPPSMWHSAENFRRASDQFNRWGEMARKMDMQFGFHNHNYEFHQFGSETGFDIITSRTDPKLVCLELDCYWLVQAGRDPVQVMKANAGRVLLIHVKDRKAGFPASQDLNEAAMHFTEVGTGSIPWREVLMEAERIGVRHYFVEQDFIAGPPLQSVETSYRNLKALMS